jgi:hypothetical protein
LTTPRGTFQFGGKSKKGKDKKGSGNNKKNLKFDVNVGGAKKEKRKVKLPCKICSEYHLTHHLPKLEEAQRLLGKKIMVVLKNPFPHGKYM